jgi:hypothetical protein
MVSEVPNPTRSCVWSSFGRKREGGGEVIVQEEVGGKKEEQTRPLI